MASHILSSPEAMRAWGRRLAKILRSGDVVALIGNLGAGKTTLTQGIAAGWGYRGETTSPTFALANEYRSKKGPLYHLDLYRLTPKELTAFPLEEYFTEGVCLIEWADRVSKRWPKETLELRLTSPDPNTRGVAFHKPSRQWQKRLKAIS